MRKKEHDALVAGAGPVGMFTALALAEQGIDVELLDAQWRTAGRSYALALHPSSLDLFEDLGLAAGLISAGHRVDTVGFYRGGDRLGELHLGDLGRKHPFVLVMPQNRLEDVLEKGLKRHRVKVRWSHRLARLEPEGDRVATGVERLVKDSSGYALAETDWVIDRTFVRHPHLVIGADGHRSLVRSLIDVDFEKVGEAQLFAVFEFTAKGESYREVRLVLDDDTVSVLWPLGDGRYRWSFQLPGTVEQEIPRIKSRFSVQIGTQPFPFVREENLEKFIAERAPWFAGRADKIRWSLAVQFESRLARRFGRGRVRLVGDSTHVTGPAGIQSMNVGLTEADELARLAASVVRDGASPNQFDTCSARHREHWLDLLGLGRQLKAGYGAEEWAKNATDRIVPLIPAAGADLEALLAQIGLRFA